MADRRVRWAAVACALALLGLAPAKAHAQSWRTVTMSRQLAGETKVNVYVRYGAGQLRLDPAEEGLLYRMRLRYDEEAFEPVAEYSGRRLELGVKGLRRGFRIGRDRSAGRMELSLARSVPMALHLELGAVRASLDLGGLALTRLDLSTGASQTRVDVSEPNTERMSRASFEVGAAEFSARHLGNLNAERIEVDAGVGDLVLDFRGQWRGDTRVSVDMGLGSLELRIPEGLGVRIVKDTFLTSWNPEGLVKRGSAYYSLNWEEAENRVTVSVDAALGKVEVVWVR